MCVYMYVCILRIGTLATMNQRRLIYLDNKTDIYCCIVGDQGVYGIQVRKQAFSYRVYSQPLGLFTHWV